MGGSPLDEAPEHTALRELKEETGLSATELLPLGRFHMSNCIADEEGFIYLARGLTEGEQELDDTEELQIRRVPFAPTVNSGHCKMGSQRQAPHCASRYDNKEW